MSFLEDALRYARAGFFVFPLMPGTKKPFPGSAGYKDATRNEEQIWDWWYDNPDANIGCWPGGSEHVVLDFDPGHEPIDLPNTLTVLTPRGMHAYYHSSEEFGNRKLAPHIDVRASHGYTVLPPSVVDGVAYAWVDEYEWPADLPEAIATQLRTPKPTEKKERTLAEIDTDKRVAEVYRIAREVQPGVIGEDSHNYTIRLVNRLLDLCSHNIVLDALVEGWLPRCLPEGGWDVEWLSERVYSTVPGTGRKDDIGCEADPEQVEYPDPEPHAKRGKVILKNGGTSKIEEISWLWNNWLARGKFHILAGCGGAGKSTLSFDLMAKISVGGSWPDGSQAPLGDVLVWSGEDNFEDTILPRFVAAGGDRKRLYCVAGIEEGGQTRAFDPSIDIIDLLETAEALENLQLVLIDPIVSALGRGTDSHKNAEVRRGLQPIVDFAEARGIALLGITHFTKGTEGKDPTERVTGSLAFGALARIVMAASTDEDGEQRRLVCAKSNISPTGGGFEYRLGRGLAEDKISAQTILWGSAMKGAARDLLSGIKQKSLDVAKVWLVDQLKDGEVLMKEISEGARANGISSATLVRAKEALGIKPKKRWDGWVWELPGDAT